MIYPKDSGALEQGSEWLAVLRPVGHVHAGEALLSAILLPGVCVHHVGRCDQTFASSQEAGGAFWARLLLSLYGVCMLNRRIALVVPRERVWNAEKEEGVLQTPERGMHASYSSGGETSGMSDVEAKSSS